jgi:hypothetical protein
LPAPFGPRNPTHFDPSIFRFRLESAVKDPYVFDRFTASIEGFVMILGLGAAVFPRL